MRIRLCVLVTCHNRVKTTLQCLDAVYRNLNIKRFELSMILVDDGSSDGTAKAVCKKHPGVNIIQGTGNLYWNGGMQLAWEYGLKENIDFYLWLNDDVKLYENAIDILFATHSAVSERSFEPIVVGNLCDPDSKMMTYGGYRIDKGAFHFKSIKINPNGTIARCDTINGNVVLIPKSAVDRVGTLDKKFTHGMGDFDYGLRCKAAGIPLLSTSGFIGECANNAPDNTWFDPKVSLLKRLEKLKMPIGLPPSEYYHYVRKHAGNITAIALIIKLYFRVIFPSIWCWAKNAREG